MQAVLQDSLGDETTLYVGETSRPTLKPREILIKVACSALNRMDLLQCKGLYPLPPGASSILGVEVSGYVEQIGEECSGRFSVGDRCMALLLGGGYAEYAVAYECCTLHAPASLCMRTLATIPEQWMTAYQLLFTVGGVKSGDTVLLHASASGVGQAAIQLATQAGAKVISTCRSDEKVKVCLDMGAIAAFNIKDHGEDFSSLVKEANGGQGVSVVLDPVGGSYANQTLESLGVDSRWVLYGLMGGKGIEDGMFLKKIMGKRICLVGSTLRARSPAYKEALTLALEAEVVPRIVSGEYKVLIDSTHDMTTEGVRVAHGIMARNQNIGKIVLQVETQNKKAKV
jgi:tumor protein p53-inducible protein 3